MLANDAAEEVGQELFLQQIETSTPPCAAAQDLLAGLRAGRRAVGEAGGRSRGPARRDGHAGASPGRRGGDADAALPPDPLGVRRDGPPGPGLRDAHARRRLLRRGGGSGGRRDPALAADARRARCQLAVLAGRDTGHASWRSQVWSRWPTAGAAQPFGDVATYRAVSEQMVGWVRAWTPGCSTSTSGWPRDYPTVEIRVADVCTDVEDALLVAVLVGPWSLTAAADPAAPDLARRPAAGRGLAGGRVTAWPVTWCTRSRRGWRRHEPCSSRRWRTAARRSTKPRTWTWCGPSFERLVARGTVPRGSGRCSSRPRPAQRGRGPRPSYRGVLGLSRPSVASAGAGSRVSAWSSSGARPWRWLAARPWDAVRRAAWRGTWCRRAERCSARRTPRASCQTMSLVR